MKPTLTSVSSRRLSAVMAAALLSLAAAASQAAVLANYPFDTAPRGNSTDTNADSTASAMIGGSGLGTDGTDWAFSTSSNALYVRSNVTGATEAAAVTGNDYVAFTLTPAPFRKLMLTSLTFRPGASNEGTGADFTVTYAVRSSVDGFTATLGSGSYTLASGGSTYTFVSTPASADLSSGQFQNLADPITFRLYVYDNQNNAPRAIGRMEDVVLNGTVLPIPEPAAISLCALAPMLLRRRRQP